MDKEEPIFNIWGEVSVSELVLEAAKVQQKYEKQQKDVASRSWRRTTCNNERKINEIVKTNRPQFSVEDSDHRIVINA